MESQEVEQSTSSNGIEEENVGSVDDKSNASSDATKSSKRARTNTSDVWVYFHKPVNGKAICKHCGKEYVCASSAYGTSTLKRHIPKCKRIKFGNVGSMMIDHEGKLRAKKIDEKRVRELMSMAIISHDLPFSFVEYKWVRELFKYLNPDMKNIGRLTATTDILKFYFTEKERLKRIMVDCPGRICLTSDCWTSCTGEGYICLTAHFVDEEWKLNSKILSFCNMEPPHTGFDLANKVVECLKDWGIEKKIFSLTLDNASANDSMIDILRERFSLQDTLLCNGDFFHVRCCAHILNLIVQDGLKVIDEATKKIREGIKYIKSSEARLKSFYKCVTEVGGIDTKVGLRMDVCTRWNSTFTMLESAIRYKRAFSFLASVDKSFLFAPTEEEWKRGEKMCEFLRPFYLITNLLSGSSYPTSNLYFMQVWKIECLLKTSVESDDDVIKQMAMKMKKKFDKYWSDYSVVLAFGAVLDPRSKFGMIKYCYDQLDPQTGQERVDHIKGKLQSLFGEYVKWMSSKAPCESSKNSSNVSSLDIPTSEGKGKAKVDDFSVFYVMEDWQSITSGDQIEKSALDQYLEEAPLQLKQFPHLNVLDYWKSNHSRNPVLSIMACDILSIPITTVASESAFSIGSRVLNKYRNRLLGKHVQALICTRSWLQGFAADVDELEEETIVIDGLGAEE